MSRMKATWIGFAGLLTVGTGCSITAVSRTELAEVVDREGIAFPAGEIPGAVVDRFAANRLVVIGETHHLQAHDDFVITLLDSLYDRGFRQLLLESPHMVDWVVEEYVSGATNLGWEPPGWFYYDIIQAVRGFNATVAPDDRIHLRSIDANLDEYGGAQDFRGLVGLLAGYLPSPGPLSAFLAGGYGTPAVQTARLDVLDQELDARETELRSLWGDRWYEQVRETVDVERVSVQIRAERKKEYERSVRRREGEMKRLADLRLEGYPQRSLMNVGCTHAQKERLMGTDIEWLGDYLVHKSTSVGGRSMVLCTTAARVLPRS
ncbi:MAG TPA: hypothetical protein VLA36_14215, partial [Longimicrobiales bacterium]|nr:hypothetical protein [Longimicrobiales bacterium]